MARKVSAAHKKALAEGRDRARKVRAYLEFLDAQKPRRGRPLTSKDLKDRIARLEEKLQEANALQELEIRQRIMDAEEQLEALEQQATTKAEAKWLTDDFVAVAKDYADAKGISYRAFRDVGVPAEVLKKAGITRGS